ncbi:MULTISPECIES: K+/H+ antiporter subunit F [Gammaproteobacteria]|uniref:K+/H+ antiporter subunit F n=1 Tax=Gammaproteobacteria TaxID=1236 RepID=UPI000DD0D3D3|nr:MULTISPECIES: K+/H+ antiporter subunit F [Gammaproteobacteria]RTE86646.1 K+/H+ antiporter subunit F [Aliidiomarina sp. B3213]TCZ90799.1 K+/H+ antiporter subunit F [Lysobacter sp. N42]
MLPTVITICIVALSIALLLNLYRLAKGPTLPDRILALDTMYINTIALIVLLGIMQSSLIFFESAMLIAMMGFVGTVAVSKYILRGDIIE